MGNKINVNTLSTENGNYTVLIHSLYKHNKEFFNVIANHRKNFPDIPIDLNLQDNNGMTLLMHAVQLSRIDVIDYLIYNSKNSERSDEIDLVEADTSMTASFKDNHIDTGDTLLNITSINIDLKDINGNDAYCYCKEPEVFKRLQTLGKFTCNFANLMNYSLYPKLIIFLTENYDLTFLTGEQLLSLIKILISEKAILWNICVEILCSKFCYNSIAKFTSSDLVALIICVSKQYELKSVFKKLMILLEKREDYGKISLELASKALS